MSPIPGAQLVKDPQAELTYEFDWTDWLGTAQITSSSFTITGGDGLLTKDNAAIVAGNLKTVVRLLGGTVGQRYTVTNHIVTNETPTQTDERSIFIRIANQ